MNAIAERLFEIHTHAEIVYEENPDQIVYKEQDIINLLVSLGHEAPVWDESDASKSTRQKLADIIAGMQEGETWEQAVKRYGKDHPAPDDATITGISEEID